MATTRLTALCLPGASFVQQDLDEPHIDAYEPFRRDNTRYLPPEFANTPTPAYILLDLDPQLTDYMQGNVDPVIASIRRTIENFNRNKVDKPGA